MSISDGLNKEPTRARCAICGWPLAEDRSAGCVPGDCSYRPVDNYRPKPPGSDDDLVSGLREQLTTTLGIARELAEALNRWVCPGCGNTGKYTVHLAQNRRSTEYPCETCPTLRAALAKARAAGILNAPAAPDSLASSKDPGSDTVPFQGGKP